MKKMVPEARPQEKWAVTVTFHKEFCEELTKEHNKIHKEHPVHGKGLQEVEEGEAAHRCPV